MPISKQSSHHITVHILCIPVIQTDILHGKSNHHKRHPSLHFSEYDPYTRHPYPYSTPLYRNKGHHQNIDQTSILHPSEEAAYSHPMIVLFFGQNILHSGRHTIKHDIRLPYPSKFHVGPVNSLCHIISRLVEPFDVGTVRPNCVWVDNLTASSLKV